MADVTAREVWNALHDRFDADVRGVARYDGAEFETVLREDVRRQYSSVDRQEIVDGLLVGQISTSELASLFEIGSLAATVRVFESAYVISSTDALDRRSGILVSLDRDGTDRSGRALERTVQYLNELTEADRD
jgi:hypothetical protein